MSDLVQLFELLSTTATAKPLSDADLAKVVAAANLDAATSQALLNRDPVELGRLLRGHAVVCCVLFPADNDEEPKDDQEPGDESQAPTTDVLAAAA